MRNDIEIIDKSNLYITVWVGRKVLRTFKFTSFGDITTINARYTAIGTTKFVSIIINEINDDGLTNNHIISAGETELESRLEVHIYDVDNNLEAIGFIEKDDPIQLYHGNGTLTENEAEYLSKINTIQIIQHADKPDDVYIYHNNKNGLSYIATSNAISYDGLCDITSNCILSDIMDYYGLSFRQDVDEEYFLDILHHFTPNVEIESVNK